MGGLLHTATRDDLYSFFSQFGDLSDCISMTGRGFGYVEFIDIASAEVVMQTPLDHVVMGKQVDCPPARIF